MCSCGMGVVGLNKLATFDTCENLFLVLKSQFYGWSKGEIQGVNGPRSDVVLGV